MFADSFTEPRRKGGNCAAGDQASVKQSLVKRIRQV
jgi:hypothetical protein